MYHTFCHPQRGVCGGWWGLGQGPGPRAWASRYELPSFPISWGFLVWTFKCSVTALSGRGGGGGRGGKVVKTSGALQDAEQQLALLVLLVLIVFFLFSPTPISPPHRYRDQLTYHTYYHCPTLGIFFVFVAVVFFCSQARGASCSRRETVRGCWRGRRGRSSDDC